MCGGRSDGDTGALRKRRGGREEAQLQPETRKTVLTGF